MKVGAFVAKAIQQTVRAYRVKHEGRKGYTEIDIYFYTGESITIRINNKDFVERFVETRHSSPDKVVAIHMAEMNIEDLNEKARYLVETIRDCEFPGGTVYLDPEDPASTRVPVVEEA